ncbi:MAG: M23 family metallopeptidase [Clostridia bacterium]|jgi:murein DD-endopeptidase MepM/ murein hydrolase activator NlpD|nr:M23 family metallopeptidase [Clostridia bacterium]
MFFREWLKKKIACLKAKLAKPQNAEKWRNLLIRGITVSVLLLAVIGLYVFQYNKYQLSVALNDKEVNAPTEAELENQSTPVFLGANDYWLEPEEPSVKEAVEPQASITVPAAGQALPNTEAAEDQATERKAEAEETVSAMAGLSWPVLLPAEGEWNRLFGYAYDDTWQDYRFHKGLDMPLEKGANVVAVWDGEIEDITVNKSQGTVITIKHTGDLKTVYAGLTANEKLKNGAQVAAGANLGVITEPPLFEEAEGPHLHFEIWEKGKAVDPLTYLP